MLLVLVQLVFEPPAHARDLANEARARWERQCQIRQEKFDLILPGAMRDNGIDISPGRLR